MQASTKICLLFLLLNLSHLKSHGQEKTDQSGFTSYQFLELDGYKMRYQTGGSGDATVVFECGHGDDLHAWDKIFGDVASFAKVFRYDREGYGFSETATQPASFKEIATRLHTLLQKAGIKPPYILVGHSLGGMLIRAYTFLYPQDVAGFVFIDPLNEYIEDDLSVDKIEEELNRMDSLIMVDTVGMSKGAETYSAEWQIMRREALNGFPEANSFGELPNVPMVLFAAGKDRPPGWENSEIKLYANRMHNLSASRFIELPQSPHYVQEYDPALVIENIQRVVFPDPENILRNTLKSQGADSCIALYKKLVLIYPKKYMLERFLNTLGYEELQVGHVSDAIKLFALNVANYPTSSNVYDSMGEAWLAAGNKKEAIKNYEKSLALNPENSHAANILKELK